MDRVVISDFDRHVLAALRSNAASGRWPAAGDVGAQLGLERDVARSALSRLRGRALAEGEGERPPGFAHTWRGEIGVWGGTEQNLALRAVGRLLRGFLRVAAGGLTQTPPR